MLLCVAFAVLILFVESDDPINPSIDVTIAGHGVFQDASIYLEQANINYGEVRSRQTLSEVIAPVC